jgi:hypothetical protein
MDISPSCPPYTPGEAVLPNVFLKRFQLHHRILPINTATAEAVTTTVGALLNTPF